MKILFLLTQDLNSPARARYLPVAVGLSKLGHSVCIAATHSNYAHLDQKEQLIGSVKVNYVGQMHVHKAGNKKEYFSPAKLLWTSLVSTIQFTRMALSTHVDLIWVGKPHPMNSIAGVIGRMRWNSRLVVDVDDDEAATGNFKGAWQKRIVGWFATMIPKLANWVTTNTQYMRSKLVESGIDPEKIVYLPNGIDMDQFQKVDLQALEELRSKYRLSNRRVIIYVGTLGLVNHPINLLIDAMGQVRAAFPSALLLVVGGGEDFDKLQEQVKKQGLAEAVIFCGKVSFEQINLYYRLAEVSVDPVYDNEVARSRCPLKLFETWASGVPFITADVGDRKYLAGDPPAALLTAPGSPQDLADAIIKILGYPDFAQSLIQFANERVKLFDWDVLVMDLEKEIQKRRKN